MAISLKGFAQAFIQNVNAVAKQNDPQLKLTPTGFLKLLLENNAVTEINNIEALRAGQSTAVKLRYLQRGLESEVTTTDTCEADLTAAWKESEVTHPLFVKAGIFVSDSDMRQYEEEAIATLAEGTPSAPLMRGLYEITLSKLIGIIGKIDTTLVSAQSTKWGTNKATGAATASTLKFTRTLDFNEGYVKLLADAAANEINDGLLICGNGIINQYDLIQKAKTGADANGFGALPVNAYYDPRTETGWGANHFGAFAKGTIGFVDWNKYVGAYAGEKGNSVFFTLPVPVEIDGALSSLVFDCQLKYNDCPTYDEEGTMTSDRGWNLFVSKHYGLWNLPSDAYAATDSLYGVNGSFHYIASLS